MINCEQLCGLMFVCLRGFEIFRKKNQAKERLGGIHVHDNLPNDRILYAR